MKKPLLPLVRDSLTDTRCYVPFGLGSDLIDDGAQKSPVTVAKLGVVWVRGVEVECRILSLQEGQQTTTDQQLSVGRRTQVMGRVATRGDIGDINEGTEGFLEGVSDLFLALV